MVNPVSTPARARPTDVNGSLETTVAPPGPVARRRRRAPPPRAWRSVSSWWRSSRAPCVQALLYGRVPFGVTAGGVSLAGDHPAQARAALSRELAAGDLASVVHRHETGSAQAHAGPARHLGRRRGDGPPGGGARPPRRGSACASGQAAAARSRPSCASTAPPTWPPCRRSRRPRRARRATPRWRWPATPSPCALRPRASPSTRRASRRSHGRARGLAAFHRDRAAHGRPAHRDTAAAQTAAAQADAYLSYAAVPALSQPRDRS